MDKEDISINKVQFKTW